MIFSDFTLGIVIGAFTVIMIINWLFEVRRRW